MLLESLKPLQVKSNVLINVSGALANNATVTIPANPKRRSLFYVLQLGGTIIYNGTSIVLAATTSQPFSIGMLNYDQLGDFIYSSLTITAGAASTALMVGETYSEERPLDQ
jgi:hypothetical protein